MIASDSPRIIRFPFHTERSPAIIHPAIASDSTSIFGHIKLALNEIRALMVYKLTLDVCLSETASGAL